MGARRPRQRAPAKAGKSDTADSSVRVQKLLSAAGIGSRREVERWIREGRLKINGEVPELGARLAARDRITVDGRPVRLRAAAQSSESRVLLFSPVSRHPARSEGCHVTGGRAVETDARRGPVARHSALAAGGRRPRDSHGRRFLGASSLARSACAHGRLRAPRPRALTDGMVGSFARRPMSRSETAPVS